MPLNSFIAALGLLAPASALLRFPCSQLTVQRLDPLVNPGQNPSAHLHQVVGGLPREEWNIQASTTDGPGQLAKPGWHDGLLYDGCAL
ncbi:hypothetical protein O1611_g10210 [Lasiodiplodia mahajangana]|uniref:Uncharacterized protein n=1 Tax=Lasiodiplodia mahajangana TaxID=1108764 RepID=A0ACC2J0V6_9PEZI|nr:hypothetical protein O1611_g10210 [Lasiodiplodia mahajangana]